MNMVVEIYTLTKKFPSHEMYGLTSQLRRASVSVPSNIAEGKLRGTRPEWQRFLSIAFGSLGEIETQMDLAKRLKYVTEEDCKRAELFINEVGRMLNVMVHQSPKARA